jgi:uncharacterized protein (TIGR03083 family)
MENARFLECLEADYRRIREVAPGGLEARVPTCPDWTVADLTRHVGQVYLHKVECMREGAERETDWPPAGLRDEDPVALLNRAYADLVAELTTRNPGDLGGTWYAPDPTAGFWFRRMAQESVIHRIDAELAVGAAVAPVPDDLALDGIDELLKVFVAYSVTEWGDYFTEALANSPGRTYKIQAMAPADMPAVAWRIKTSPGHFTVEGGPGEKLADEAASDVIISGTPTDVLRWSWNRETPGKPSRVTVAGSPIALAELRRCVVIATQ